MAMDSFIKKILEASVLLLINLFQIEILDYN